MPSSNNWQLFNVIQGFFIRVTRKLSDREEEGEELVLAGDKAAWSLGLLWAVLGKGQGGGAGSWLWVQTAWPPRGES